MKNKIFTIILLITLAGIFSFYISWQKNTYEVLEIISADKFAIDLNHNGVKDNGEIICLNGATSFNIESGDNENEKYNNFDKITKIDNTNLWYLSREFAQKILLNKNIKLKLKGRENTECKYGDISIDGTDYSDILLQSGFGIKNNKIGNIEKFKKNLEISKKLNLVILNHHSNIYHTLECEYGQKAHDKIIIPLKQLPKGVRPCHFCHNIKDKNKKKNNKYFASNITIPTLKLYGQNIALYKFDYTKKLAPDSKCNTEVCKLIVKAINNSKQTIDIAIYGYDDIPAITSALINANQRNVKIRFVYDESIDPSKTFYKGNYIIKNVSSDSKSDINSKEKASIMHNKFIIIDKTTVITGSMNYSPTGLSGYDLNDIVVINSPQIAALYTNEFEQMLNGKFHNEKLRNNNQKKFILDHTEIEIYFSPQDKSSKRIIELINNAKKYIYIPTFLITHKSITEALINAKKRNIDVKIIIDANSVNTKNTKHKILRENHIPLKAENYAGKLHSKTMIIDDTYLVIGSMNFSNSGENRNDENMLVIKNYRFAQNYKEFFLYLWNIIPEKYLKYSPRAESYDSIGSCQDRIDNNFDGKIDSEDNGCKIR